MLWEDDGAPIGIFGISMDITDRKREKEALLKLRNLLAIRLESLREEGRERITLEEHDVLGQALIGLKLDVLWVTKQILESQGWFESAPVLSRQAMSRELTNSTIQSVRTIASKLWPSGLDQFGLEADVEWQARKFGFHIGIACATSISLEHLGVGNEQSIVFFRVIQEVLTTVARHGHFTKVGVKLEESSDSVIMQITDNCKDITSVEQSRASSFGLLGMRLRTQQEGESFAIHGMTGKRTMVTATLPPARTRDAFAGVVIGETSNVPDLLE